jgi:hypothetical protein
MLEWQPSRRGVQTDRMAVAARSNKNLSREKKHESIRRFQIVAAAV